MGEHGHGGKEVELLIEEMGVIHKAHKGSEPAGDKKAPGDNKSVWVGDGEHPSDDI